MSKSKGSQFSRPVDPDLDPDLDPEKPAIKSPEFSDYLFGSGSIGVEGRPPFLARFWARGVLRHKGSLIRGFVLCELDGDLPLPFQSRGLFTVYDDAQKRIVRVSAQVVWKMSFSYPYDVAKTGWEDGEPDFQTVTDLEKYLERAVLREHGYKPGKASDVTVGWGKRGGQNGE